jgi:tetratricopeptide (TPR) repeat protein/transcriptional regulator with XRE-family HTH domain
VASQHAGFGELVRRHRAARHLTQEALATRSGLSVRAIADIERGRTGRPHHGSMLALAEALGLADGALQEFTSATGTGDGQVHGARGLAPSADADAGHQVVPRQLPAGLAFFAGRTAELGVLTSVARRAGGTPGAVVTALISGTAGIGKTALALHWAHQAAGRFPDGQLYVGLRGFDLSGEPVTTAAAIRGFLDAMGVPPGQIPPSPEAQLSLYRSLLADRQMLIILDNARDSAQVAPLLPASPASLVLVTSRNQMADLIAAQGAYPLHLDLPGTEDARRLLALRLGTERLAAEPGAVRQLIDLCARLPLALSIAAARAATHPHFALASLVSELRDARGRLDVLDWGEGASSPRTVFSWSYQQLSAPAARMFRLLGAHPGADVTVPAAAMLAGIAADQARQALAELHQGNLLTEPAPGRFAFHDLLRAYATELIGAPGREAERRAALDRLLDYYLDAAAAAVNVALPGGREHRPRVPPPATAAPAPGDPATSRAWLDAERANLVAVAVHAADRSQSRQAILMASTLSQYLNAGGYCAEAVALHSRTRRAARDAGDRSAEAAELTSLGNAEYLQGHYQQAADYHQQAVALSRQAGDRAAEARALNGLGMEESALGDYRQAVRHWRRTVAWCREAGERHGLAITLSNLGVIELRLGRSQQAAGHLREALEISDQADRTAAPDIFRRAVALNGLGQVELSLGHREQARDYLHQALASLRQARYPLSEVDALDSLARVELALGRCQQARDYLHQALAIVRQTGMDMAEAQSVNNLGQVLLAAGHPGQARAEHTRALALASQTGARYEQARAHDGLGNACQAAGDRSQAREHWRQALAIYSAIGVPEAQTVRGRLEAAADAAHTDAGPLSH